MFNTGLAPPPNTPLEPAAPPEKINAVPLPLSPPRHAYNEINIENPDSILDFVRINPTQRLFVTYPALKNVVKLAVHQTIPLVLANLQLADTMQVC